MMVNTLRNKNSKTVNEKKKNHPEKDHFLINLRMKEYYPMILQFICFFWKPILILYFWQNIFVTILPNHQLLSHKLRYSTWYKMLKKKQNYFLYNVSILLVFVKHILHNSNSWLSHLHSQNPSGTPLI